MTLNLCKKSIQIKASILEKDEESSPCYHGRVGDARCINTPGCQTVKFLLVLPAKCPRKPATGEAFGHLGAVEIIYIEKQKQRRKLIKKENCQQLHASESESITRDFRQTQRTSVTGGE